MTDSMQQSTMGLLGEIGTGTAAKLVMASRYSTSPFGPTFLPPLDDALLAARPHHGGSSINRGDLIELSGPTGSGKTTLLNFLLLTTLLPSSFILDLPDSPPAEVALGGRSGHAALIYPATHIFPLTALEKGIKAHISSCVLALGQRLTKSIQKQIDAQIQSALSKLRVVRIPKARWKFWALALRGLVMLKEGGLDLVVCDGFADGFWPERWADETGGGGSKRTGARSGIGIRGGEDVGMKDVMDCIGRLRKGIGAVVVLSMQGLWHTTHTDQSRYLNLHSRLFRIEDQTDQHLQLSSGGPFYSTHLPPPYPASFTPNQEDGHGSYQSRSAPSSSDPTMWPVNIQISLPGRIKPLQLPPDISLIDALRSKTALSESEHDVSQRYEGAVRVTGAEGQVGSRTGVKWEWKVGPEGLEAWSS